MQHLPLLSVRSSGGLKWMLKQHSGLMPSSCIWFLGISSGGLLGFSNAILTLQTMGPYSMLWGCTCDSTCHCVCTYVDRTKYVWGDMLTTDLFHAGLTVHGVINGSMIQQGVASSKISNVSSGPLSQIQMSLILQSLFCLICDQVLYRQQSWRSHNYMYIECTFIENPQPFVHFCFCGNIDALYMHLTSREHTCMQSIATVLMVIGNHYHTPLQSLHKKVSKKKN